MSGDHPNYNIIENGQNTEKSPGDLGRLAVTQTPVKNHQLKVMGKTLKKYIIMICIKIKELLIIVILKKNVIKIEKGKLYGSTTLFANLLIQTLENIFSN